MGGAIGQGRVVDANLSSPSSVATYVPSVGDFKANHSAYKLMVGIRAVSLFGAELAYIDFGHPHGAVFANLIPVAPVSGANASAEVGTKGTAVFGVLYLPVPIVDIFVKAGVAHLRTAGSAVVGLSGTLLCTSANPNCLFSQAFSTTDSGFAAGAGAQLKFGAAAVRGEYERYSAAGGNPSLFSLGLTWTF